MGITEKKMEATGIIGIIGYGILGLYRENGKENGNDRDYRDYIGYSILGLYRDNGEEKGNNYNT